MPSSDDADPRLFSRIAPSKHARRFPPPLRVLHQIHYQSYYPRLSNTLALLGISSPSANHLPRVATHLLSLLTSYSICGQSANTIAFSVQTVSGRRGMGAATVILFNSARIYRICATKRPRSLLRPPYCNFTDCDRHTKNPNQRYRTGTYQGTGTIMANTLNG